MDVITIDEVKYVKASSIAKQFKYTSDYVGQLCRGKKVDAKLVGRTWYVNPLSLEDHKSNRYNIKSDDEEEEQEIDSKAVHKVEISKQSVEAVVRKSTVKSFRYSPENKPNSAFLKHVEWKPLKFETDENDLIPKVSKANANTRIPVNVAESERVEIKSPEKPFVISREELPTISLAGEIKVHSIQDQFVENEPENEVFVDEEEEKNVIIESRVNPRTPNKQALKRTLSQNKSVNQAYSVSIHDETELNFTPRRVSAKRTVPDSTLEEEEEASTKYLGYLVFIIIVAGLLILFVGLDSVLLADDQNFEQSFRLSF